MTGDHKYVCGVCWMVGDSADHLMHLHPVVGDPTPHKTPQALTTILEKVHSEIKKQWEEKSELDSSVISIASEVAKVMAQLADGEDC